ncbi:MAG: S-methyl-5-thioribose-1-phosphate isomerase [Ilumatobacter sp.]|uniref:S-methyl-5-thioribose-1-phosphate isomerase n=1 Tax=Ilumatobacter sp. TaxID=1967498 RepID=UPI002619E015|nr:S-methyl-5-thioribose-1-phosphate isomerase [Ilumatobacter sp.]MDJ0767265.1 S-methyl-5-thioribose-1-phosphate isomerase [Ilumatobacter sp.]
MFERTIWWAADEASTVVVVDQTRLPHEAAVARWRCLDDAAAGIRTMQVRGAPLIGVAAAHGLALAMHDDPRSLDGAIELLAATRPTAVNLRWALERGRAVLEPLAPDDRPEVARRLSTEMADEDADACRAIGEAGVGLLADVHERTARPVQVLTHCNAGWLACVEWGTATAPVYVAHERGIPVHVWVSETRPRNQGAALTAWELGHRGVPHTLVVDNAAGHLLRTGMVDLVVVGADRIARNGDVANKIGTALKALAARDAGVPFLVAAPRSTFDPQTADGDAIPIEERDDDEILTVNGRPIAPPGTRARNWAFDVTAARLVDRYVTDRGVLEASEITGWLRG